VIPIVQCYSPAPTGPRINPTSSRESRPRHSAAFYFRWDTCRKVIRQLGALATTMMAIIVSTMAVNRRHHHHHHPPFEKSHATPTYPRHPNETAWEYASSGNATSDPSFPNTFRNHPPQGTLWMSTRAKSSGDTRARCVIRLDRVRRYRVPSRVTSFAGRGKLMVLLHQKRRWMLFSFAMIRIILHFTRRS